MEISSIQPYSWDVVYNNHPLPLLFPFSQFLENYIHWTQTPESHIYSADIPGIHRITSPPLLTDLTSFHNNLEEKTYKFDHVFLGDALSSGVRKEEIKVEVEDSKYLIIRTDIEAVERKRSFMRMFRLPSRIDLEGISAGYENGVLTVTVPRSDVRRGFYIDPSDLPDNSSLEVTARAA